MSKITDIVNDIIVKTNANTSGQNIHNATEKETPVDADELVILDSVSSFSLKKLTWANLKNVLFGSPTFTGTPTLNGEELVKLSSDGLRIEKSNDATIKNQCTAWVNFDGTTTPPTIRDSYNVSSVVRAMTGIYEIYFEEAMDNSNYAQSVLVEPSLSDVSFIGGGSHRQGTKSTTKTAIGTVNYTDSTFTSFMSISVQIFGGKN